MAFFTLFFSTTEEGCLPGDLDRGVVLLLLLSTFEPAYTMRPLSLAFLRDQYADHVERVRACVLRCYPHEWSVLFEQEGEWCYAGRFDSQPPPEQLESMLEDALTSRRNAGYQAMINRQNSGGD